MSRLTEGLRNVFKIEELRQRLLFTGLMLLVVRVGSFISVPGINVKAVLHNTTSGSNTLFGFFDMFVGGAYTKGAIFALGIMPYISASIIVQLLTAVMPYFQKLQQEGEQGRKQLNSITRYLTVGLSFAQGLAIALSLQSQSAGNVPVVNEALQGVPFMLMAATIFTAGTIFLMWIGEQITEKGIGNGTSLIIFIGIIARLIPSIREELSLIASGTRNPIVELVVVAALLGVIAVVVLFTQAIRKIPVQYAKRMVAGKTYSGSGQTSFIPIQLITANVMPIIFASAIMFLPNLLATAFPGTGISSFINQNFKNTDLLHNIVFAILIIFFSFFYTAIVIQSRDVAENMRKSGGFIPGIRPGKPTEEYIDRVLVRVTVPGSLFLALIAVLPVFIGLLGVTGSFASFFGGTTVLIMVGVALDTLKQVEAYLLMRHYDGFMKSGKLRGRLQRQIASS
ncbi:MAG: preprotein translocase subunit SecY [Bacteroidetes bacterium]|nr:preprotein translocase subunit SecY [Bacteroidota bacterium]